MAGPGSGPVGQGPEGGAPVPHAVLRSWDEAEARLFPTIMARPDVYQQSVTLIQQLVGRLRDSCQDLPSLLAAHERGGELVGDLAGAGIREEAAGIREEAAGIREEAAGIREEAAGIRADLAGAGIRADLVAAAACAMRYRELVASLAAQGRLAALARARDQGQSWTVAGETGSQARAPYVPYQRIEAEASTGRAVIISIEPDETLSRALYRLEQGQIDLVTGGLRIGEAIGSYLDRDAFTAALREARLRPKTG